MNIVAQMPRWAQRPAQQFLDQQPIAGTERLPLTEDGFQQSFQQGTGVVSLAAQDEVPGEDLALGKPGEVRRNGATIYCQGDSSQSRGTLEAVVLGRRGSTEYVTYAFSTPQGLRTLRMVNDDGSVELQASQIEKKSGQIQGYLLSGSFSAQA